MVIAHLYDTIRFLCHSASVPRSGGSLNRNTIISTPIISHCYYCRRELDYTAAIINVGVISTSRSRVRTILMPYSLLAGICVTRSININAIDDGDVGGAARVLQRVKESIDRNRTCFALRSLRSSDTVGMPDPQSFTVGMHDASRSP